MGNRQKARRHRSKQPIAKTTSRRDFRRYGVILAMVLILFGAAIVFSPSGQPGTLETFVPEVLGAPRVAIAQDEVDFGDVKLDKTVEAVFRVRNIGDQVLRILDQEPPVELVEGC